MSIPTLFRHQGKQIRYNIRENRILVINVDYPAKLAKLADDIEHACYEAQYVHKLERYDDMTGNIIVKLAFNYKPADVVTDLELIFKNFIEDKHNEFTK